MHERWCHDHKTWTQTHNVLNFEDKWLTANWLEWLKENIPATIENKLRDIISCFQCLMKLCDCVMKICLVTL
jgi:hypothetical protein